MMQGCVAASKRQQIAGVLMVAVSLLYLTHFVSRGWIPHDEGMLAQSAERVLAGEIPHVAYEEPYTGGLTWIYAGLFRLTGTELLNVRWLLLLVAIASMCLLYGVLRRFLAPPGAALATSVGLAWSFPNYFAGLPSWWLLLAALGCTWATVRYVESGGLRYLMLAGAAAGSAVAIKQTGVYLPVALTLTLLYWRTQSPHAPTGWRFVAGTAGIVSLMVAAAILGGRLWAAEGLYLLLPITACCATLLMRRKFSGPSVFPEQGAWPWIVLAGSILLPIGCVLAPYVVNGHLKDFFAGAFLLPRKRLTFATYPMPPAAFIVTGFPAIALFVPLPKSTFGARVAAIHALIWVSAILLPFLALWNAGVYQCIWQSVRALAVLTPVAICYRLVRGDVPSARQAAVLYGLAAGLAWMSLNQFPFAAPVYFVYVTPLAVIAIVALAAATNSLDRHVLLPWSVMILLFALLTMNRGYIFELGVAHHPRQFSTPLNLQHAHLRVEEKDASTYRKTVALIEQHLNGGRLVAGPDTPELYYLTDTWNSRGTLFEFFSGADSANEWTEGQVIVINHRPPFSRKPTPEVVAELRRDFPAGEQIDRFEVRWR